MLRVHSKSPDQHSVRALEKAEARYKALYDGSEKAMMDKREDFDETYARLFKHLGSELEVTNYLEWVTTQLPKPVEYDLVSQELAIHLEKANWFEGNLNLHHLYSILWQSIVSTKYFSQDLNRRLNGFQMGLRIYGRPVDWLPTDVDRYENKEIFVNWELLLAVGFVAFPDRNQKEITTMIFTPLGYILIQSQNSKNWMATELALIAEIPDTGLTGKSHLISTRTEQDVDTNKTCKRSAGINDEEWEELQSFHRKLSFTMGRLDDGIDLLKNDKISKRNEELFITIISKSSLKIVETGQPVNSETGLPIALYPADE